MSLKYDNLSFYWVVAVVYAKVSYLSVGLLNDKTVIDIRFIV